MKTNFLYQIYFKLILTILLWGTIMITQTFAQERYLQGYQEEVSGKRFTYHSPLPDVKYCLLARAQADYDPIEWKTEIVPKDYNKKEVSFIWLYGIRVQGESKNFDVNINGKKYFTFSNPLNNEKETWSVNNSGGASLTFHRTMIDKYKDQMGFAVLTLPTKDISLGKQVTIKIEGAKEKSNAWFMTFKTSLKNEFNISQLKVVGKENGKLYHIARFSFMHLGKPSKVVITVGDKQKETILKPGYNSIDFKIDRVETTTELTALVKIGASKASKHKFKIAPVKKWTVYLVQHTHTDIGYTRPQTEILSEHLRYIDYALDYCDQTDDYPDNARFRWTTEASWAVREYLKSRPKSQIDRLRRRIKEGRIEVTGMFFNFSEIVDETALAMQTKTLKALRENGIEVKTAMQDDVNGIGWCMVDYYKNTGVKYLTMGEHGHRAQIPFDKPTPFWWQSPSGNKLLAYRSEHYMHGNVLGLTSGNLNVFTNNLAKYLEDLEAKVYPYDRISFQFSGYVTDNSPPSTIACDIVKEWNDKYEWPKLKLAVDSEFMNYLEQNKSDILPVKKVAWPDWWTDGFGSAMNESKAARTTHADMIANMGLFSMAKILGAKLPESIDDEIRECYDNLLFYDEHTFGSAESITDPLIENSIIQWGEKSAYVWTAVKEASLLKEKAMGFIQPYIGKSDKPTIAVFNTLNWNRSGMVEVYIDHEILPLNKKFEITDKDGNKIQTQAMRNREDGTYWALWIPDIPAFGYKILTINVSNEAKQNKPTVLDEHILQNDFYKIEFDKSKGFISSIFDKELQIDLLNKNNEIKLGEFIYEQIENRHSMERLTAANRDTVYVPLKKKITTLSNIAVSDIVKGDLWTSIKLHGNIPKCTDDNGVNIEIRLYNHDKRIELLYDMIKLPVTTPEAVYVAFPFELEDKSHIVFDVQGGVVSPGINQLEGTSSDWNTIQNFAAVRNNKSQIVFCGNDNFLAQFGEINTGRFYYKHIPEKTHIYSWVLNNYWTTNFKASQEGEMKWHYYITSSSDNSNTFATRFGWSNRIPLLTRVMPAGQTKQETISRSIINLDVPNLLLVNAKPSLDGRGIILHLRETEGKQAILDIAKLQKETNAKSIKETNILEDEIKALSKALLFENYETKFIKILIAGKER